MQKVLDEESGELIGFPDEISADEINTIVRGDKYGQITEYKPGFYDKVFAPALREAKIDIAAPNFIADLGKSLYSGASQTAVGYNKLIAANLEYSPILTVGEVISPGFKEKALTGFRNTFITPYQAQIDDHDRMVADMPTAQKLANQIATGFGTMVDLPILIASGGATRTALTGEAAAQSIANAEKGLMSPSIQKVPEMIDKALKATVKIGSERFPLIHDAAIGMAEKVLAQETAEGKGLKAVPDALMAGTGAQVAAGNRLVDYAEGALFSTAYAHYQSLQELGRFASWDEVTGSVANFLGMQAAFHTMAKISQVKADHKDNKIIRDLSGQLDGFIKEKNLGGAYDAVVKTLVDSDLSPETKSDIINSFNMTREAYLKEGDKDAQLQTELWSLNRLLMPEKAAKSRDPFIKDVADANDASYKSIRLYMDHHIRVIRDYLKEKNPRMDDNVALASAKEFVEAQAEKVIRVSDSPAAQEVPQAIDDPIAIISGSPELARKTSEKIIENVIGHSPDEEATPLQKKFDLFLDPADIVPGSEKDIAGMRENIDSVMEAYNKATMKEYKTMTPVVSSGDLPKTMDLPFRSKFRSEDSVPRHAAASALAKIFDSEHLNDPKNEGKPVMILGGTSGAGKTHSTKDFVLDEYALVKDTNLNSLETGRKHIDNALRSGHPVEVLLIERDPIEAFKDGVWKRFIDREEHRIVPIDVHVKNSNAREAFKQLQRFYSSNPATKNRVRFNVLINQTGKAVREGGLEDLGKLGYTDKELKQQLVEFVNQQFEQGARLSDGTGFTKAQLDEFIGRSPAQERLRSPLEKQADGGEKVSVSGQVQEGPGRGLKSSQKPVESSGDEFKSRAFERVKSRFEAELEGQDAYYNRVTLAEDTAKAIEFADKETELARKIAMGLIDPPAGMTETGVAIAYAEKMRAAGNMKEFARAERSRSLRQTRRGQEISAERGRANENSEDSFIREVLRRRIENAGRKQWDLSTMLSSDKDSLYKRGTARLKKETDVLKKAVETRKLDIAAAQKIIDKLIC